MKKIVILPLLLLLASAAFSMDNLSIGAAPVNPILTSLKNRLKALKTDKSLVLKGETNLVNFLNNCNLLKSDAEQQGYQKIVQQVVKIKGQTIQTLEKRTLNSSKITRGKLFD